jgi:hypothetical protein
VPKTKLIQKKQKEEIELLKQKYPRGKKVRLIFMDFDEPVKRGTFGKIYGIDDLGQIIVEWECGSEISLIPEKDEFEIIN